MGKFENIFPTITRNVVPHVLDYLMGQLLLESQRNMSRMSVEVAAEDGHSYMVEESILFLKCDNVKINTEQ